MRLTPHDCGRYFTIVFYRTFAGIKLEGRKNYLGYLWYLLEPILSTAVLYLVFGKVFKSRGGNYIAFLLIGLVSWQWFESSLYEGMFAIKAKLGIMQTFDLPKFLFPVVQVCVNTWKFLCVYAIILIFAALFGFLPQRYYLMLPVVMLVQFILIIGISTMLAICVTYFNDFAALVSTILRLLFFFSGIFFDASKIPADLRTVFFMNPMAGLIDSYRAIIIGGKLPQMHILAYDFGVAVVFLLLGLLLCSHVDRKILKSILTS